MPQLQVIPPSAPSRPIARAASADPRRNVQALQAQLTELKCQGHSAAEENMRTRTRLMALEKELSKRERVLQSMVKLKQAGLGLGLDLIEKLREERNLLPIYRRKVHDLQSQMEDRDLELQKMKRDPFFTRVLELQVEYVSWKQEGKRLDSLLADPSTEVNDVARQEEEVHERRCTKLQQELEAAERQRDQVMEELEDAQAEHESWDKSYKDREQELTRQHDLTRDLAVAFKQLLQTRKQAEKLQGEIDEMDLTKRQNQEQIEELEASLKAAAEKEEREAAMDSCTITGDALAATEAKLAGVDRGLWLLRRNVGQASYESLFACLRALDEDEDGLLSHQELVQALSQWHGCPLEAEQAAKMLEDLLLPPEAAGPSCSVRWLDIVAGLDSLGNDLSSRGIGPSTEEELPELRPLRWACIRARKSSEELRQEILSIDRLAAAESYFGVRNNQRNAKAASGRSLALPADEAVRWVEAWKRLGSRRLLLLLPLSEAAMPSLVFDAWQARVRQAVQKNKKDLAEAFTVEKVGRPDSVLRQRDFRMICRDVLGVELDEEDIEDLMLMFIDTELSATKEVVNGKALLQKFGS
eukprot:TRINITY_DN23495_c0_g1_i1.p1 TRINITY_DN23495_c0_g1~~TRINITY_DN23495_c0_g1_i1.p1  ORF type:complete len:634 (+),score=188.04 TRINITY_DN23495_c0_g1_i1:149-1903(+)